MISKSFLRKIGNLFFLFIVLCCGLFYYYKGDNKISSYNMNLSETYICDYCKTKLNVTTNIDFFVKSPQVKQSHVTKFKRSNLQLTEK